MLENLILVYFFDANNFLEHPSTKAQHRGRVSLGTGLESVSQILF